MSGTGIDLVPDLPKVSGTGIYVGLNLPTCPVPVLMSYRYRTGTDLGKYTGGICRAYPVFHGGTCLGSTLYAVQNVPFGLSSEKKKLKI